MTKFVGTLNIPSLSSAPGTAQEGDLYYNTSTDKVNFYNGTAWVEVGAGAGNKVYYQTSAPTGGTYATGDIWIDSDSILGGPIELTNSVSSTSTTTAATPNNVKTAYDIATAGWEAFNFGAPGRVATHPRFMTTVTNAGSSGQVQHTRIIPHRDITVSNISFVGVTVASSPTTIRFGIYTRSGTTFTLVARTAIDTTIFAATNTKYTRALSTAGGYPATYEMTAGNEYWISIFQDATTGATLLAGGTHQGLASNAATGVRYYITSLQTDLPATATGSTSGTAGGNYAEVS